MAIPSWKLTNDYNLKNNDLVLLFFCNGQKACFPAAKLPVQLQDIKPPREKGASAAVFIGKISGKRIHVKTIRLDAEHFSPLQKMKKEIASAISAAKDCEAARIFVPMAKEHEDLICAAHEGAVLGGYSFDKYLKKKAKPAAVVVATGSVSSALNRNLGKDKAVYEFANFARDISNEPPNYMSPSTMAPKLRSAGAGAGLKVTIWNEQRLKKEHCGGIVAVGRGSKDKPRLMIGEYAPRGAVASICLVGKGVTFDTGGYCLKGSAHQIGMKYDMSGAAMMWAASCAIARLKLPVKLTVFAPLVENRISDISYLTSDVLKMRNGMTVEVSNTDAEGRLIIADSLVLASERKPDCIIDAATLTGACVTALGEDIAGAYGTNDNIVKQLISAGHAVGENFWQLPLYMPYMGQLDATIADCKNCGSGQGGGSITGALFLKKFVSDKTKWMHLDIAGPAGKEDSLDHLGKGSKGFGVKTIVKFVETMVS